MVSVRARQVRGRVYYYLVHTFRVDGRVRSVERYLGTRVPEDLSEATERLIAQEWAVRWYPEFEAYRQRSRREESTAPVEVRAQRLEDFSIRFTFNTNRIEGSQLTLLDTSLLLREKLTPGSKPLSDVVEAQTHQATFLRAIRTRGDAPRLATVLRWHQEIFGETKSDLAGALRTYRVAITNSRFSPPLPSEVPRLLREFFVWRTRHRPVLQPVQFAAESHLRFESIHPFGDGNGRVGRLLLNVDLWNSGYPLFDLAEERRLGYYKALEASSVGGGERPFLRWFFPEYLRDDRPRPINLRVRVRAAPSEPHGPSRRAGRPGAPVPGK